MNDYVVTFRMKDGVDILAVIIGELNGVVRVEHPHIVKYYPNDGGYLTMIPYCTLTDETYFEFPKDEMKFLVTASEQIAIKFLAMIATSSIKKVHQHLQEVLAPLEEEPSYVEGNETKH